MTITAVAPRSEVGLSMAPSASLSSYSPRKLWAGTLVLVAEISFGCHSPFECVISVPPQSRDKAWLVSQNSGELLESGVFSFFTCVLLFFRTCCLPEPLASEDCIS